MIERFLARTRLRHPLSEEEVAVLQGLVANTREIRAGEVVVPQGKRLDQSTLLLDGLLCRHKDLSNGQRQITDIHVAGDFADLHSFTLKHLDHAVQALTDGAVGLVPHARLTELTEKHPRLTRVLWFSTNVDAAIHREWELSLGRRTAEQRLGALLCELQARLGLVGLASEEGYDLPLIQMHLAECVGLTQVHVNRMLRQLRERGLVTVANGRVTLHDLRGLQRLSEWGPDYLYLEPVDL